MAEHPGGPPSSQERLFAIIGARSGLATELVTTGSWFAERGAQWQWQCFETYLLGEFEQYGITAVHRLDRKHLKELSDFIKALPRALELLITENRRHKSAQDCAADLVNDRQVDRQVRAALQHYVNETRGSTQAEPAFQWQQLAPAPPPQQPHHPHYPQQQMPPPAPPPPPPFDRAQRLIAIVQPESTVAKNLNAALAFFSEHGAQRQWEWFEEYLADAFDRCGIIGIHLHARMYLRDLSTLIKDLEAQLSTAIWESHGQVAPQHLAAAIVTRNAVYAAIDKYNEGYRRKYIVSPEDPPYQRRVHDGPSVPIAQTYQPQPQQQAQPPPAPYDPVRDSVDHLRLPPMQQQQQGQSSGGYGYPPQDPRYGQPHWGGYHYQGGPYY
ncbi:hypothetical protein JCM10908_002706 [Rhodotorula pacifica]|uniref:uncharacterized protein n=1 Tax=Rhodotorula pacifica TaxID=1495444 RepID=UPI0031804B3C